MAVVQRKNLKKGSRAIAAAVCFLLFTVTAVGCGGRQRAAGAECAACRKHTT